MLGNGLKQDPDALDYVAGEESMMRSWLMILVEDDCRVMLTGLSKLSEFLAADAKKRLENGEENEYARGVLDVAGFLANLIRDEARRRQAH